MTDQEIIVLRAMKKINPRALDGALVSISSILKALPYPKATTKKLILGLARKDVLALHAHDHAASMSADERKLLIYEGGRYYNGAAIRSPEGLPKEVRNPMPAKKASKKIKKATPPSVRVKGAKRRNPSYKVEAKVPSHIRPISYNVKVPTRTLAILATRGYVQEMGGGNPNAYTYKTLRLGLGHWQVDAIPKVKSSSGTVKALTAGSAVRKFKKTLAGRGRFKTPRGAYDISVQRNPKKKSAKKRRNPSTEDFALAGRIARQIEALKKKSKSAARDAQIKKLEAYKARVFARALAVQRQEEMATLSAPAQFSTKRKGGSVRKKANPRAARSYEASMAKVQVALDKLYLKPSPTTADKQKIKKLERYQTSIFNKSWADEEGQFKEGLKKESLRAQKLDARREKATAKKKAANPRKRKPAAKARTNSIGSSIKKVVKSVKKVFKKRNDGSADREEFAGKVSGYKELFFPPGTPQGLSTLGPLDSFTTTHRGKISFPKGQAVLCQDSSHNLYVGSTKPDAALYSNGGPLRNADLGKIKQVEYDCAKPHLGAKYAKVTSWYHDFESPLPHLRTDEEGRPIIEGGGYTIKREGITG